MKPTLQPEVVAVQREIEQLGFTVRFVDYCEDSRTPGLLGYYAGVTDWSLSEVKIKTKGRRASELVETLKHELHHVQDPAWEERQRLAARRQPDDYFDTTWPRAPRIETSIA